MTMSDPAVSTVQGSTSDKVGRNAPFLRSRIQTNEVGVFIAILVLILVTGATHPRFVSVQSMANIAQAAAFFGIMSLGTVFLLAMREMDLSVGSIYGLSIVTSALLVQHGLNAWVSACVGILVGGVLGAINGIVSSIFRVPVLIVTLGSLTAFAGVSSAISHSQTINLESTSSYFDLLGGTYLRVPLMVFAFLVLAFLLSVLFKRTRFGFAVRSVGANPRAAELSGYSIARVRVTATLLSGALCGLAGVLTLAYFGAADPSQGNGYEIQVIAAAIIGGTSLVGGSGTVWGAVLGSILISLIQASLIQFGVSANLGYIVTGTVIVAAVGLDSTIRRLRATRLRTG